MSFLGLIDFSNTPISAILAIIIDIIVGIVILIFHNTLYIFYVTPFAIIAMISGYVSLASNSPKYQRAQDFKVGILIKSFTGVKLCVY
ncbi:MAG: hypothetical protein ACFFBY_01390 [Promethearchaeota archaeon]